MRKSLQDSKQFQLISDQSIEALNRILNKPIIIGEYGTKKQLTTFTTNYKKLAQLVMNTLQINMQMLAKENVLKTRKKLTKKSTN